DIADARLEIKEALQIIAAPGTGPPRQASSADQKAAARPTRLAWWAAAAATGLLAMGIGAVAATWELGRSEYARRNPLEGAKVAKLTDFGGAEHHAAISRDGKF